MSRSHSVAAALSGSPLPTAPHTTTHLTTCMKRRSSSRHRYKADKFAPPLLSCLRTTEPGCRTISGQVVRQIQWGMRNLKSLHQECRGYKISSLDASVMRLAAHIDILEGLCAAEGQDERSALAHVRNFQQHRRDVRVLLLIRLAACSNKCRCSVFIPLNSIASACIQSWLAL